MIFLLVSKFSTVCGKKMFYWIDYIFTMLPFSGLQQSQSTVSHYFLFSYFIIRAMFGKRRVCQLGTNMTVQTMSKGRNGKENFMAYGFQAV